MNLAGALASSPPEPSPPPTLCTSHTPALILPKTFCNSLNNFPDLTRKGTPQHQPDQGQKPGLEYGELRHSGVYFSRSWKGQRQEAEGNGSLPKAGRSNCWPEFLCWEEILALSTNDLHEPSFPTAIKWGNKVGKKG